MDIWVIVYCAELEAPVLRQTARRILESEAARLGVPLDPAGTLIRRAAGDPEPHIMAAACGLVDRLVETEADPLSDQSMLLVLARIGALVLANQVELDEDGPARH
jgi:hypothetical protein